MSQTERPQEADHPVDENSGPLDPDCLADPYPSGKNAKNRREEPTDKGHRGGRVGERVALLDRLRDAPEKEATGWLE